MERKRPLKPQPFAKEGDREFVRMVVAWGATVSPAIRADVLRMADLIKQQDRRDRAGTAGAIGGRLTD